MVLLQDLLDYFLYSETGGYDVPKTIIFSILLVLASYLIYRSLKKLKVKIDYRLAIGISPYIAFGSTLRVLKDAGILESFLFKTPGIYILVFGITFIVLVISLILEKKYKIPYHKTLFLFGLIVFSFSTAFLVPTNFKGIALVLVIYLPWLVILSLFKKWSATNRTVLSVQMFDAIITFVSINFFGQNNLGSFGFFEQHLVPAFIMNIFGPFSFVIVKLIAITAVLFLIDRFSKDREFNNYLKLIIAVLGAATGTRDFIALATLIG
jgi:uncharacterized membrane protein